MIAAIAIVILTTLTMSLIIYGLILSIFGNYKLRRDSHESRELPKNQPSYDELMKMNPGILTTCDCCKFQYLCSSGDNFVQTCHFGSEWKPMKETM